MLVAWLHRCRRRRLDATVEREPVEVLIGGAGERSPAEPPPPVDGAPADRPCVGLADPSSGNCSRLADWHTAHGYLCDDHYLALLERPGKAWGEVNGYAEVQADGRWRVFENWPDAGGRYTLVPGLRRWARLGWRGSPRRARLR